MDDPKWKGILLTPFSLISHQSVKRTEPRINSRAQTFSKSKGTEVRTLPQTDHKTLTTPSRQSIKYGVWMNEKNISYRFYHLRESRLVQPCNTPKVSKHPGLGLKVDTKPVTATHMHASSKKAPHVTPGSKLV